MEAFVQACRAIGRGDATPGTFSEHPTTNRATTTAGTMSYQRLATLDSTFRTTAILEAGRMSLDGQGRSVEILYHEQESEETFSCIPVTLQYRN